MAFVSCSSCGAQVEESSRFCRSCGRAFDPGELTTRKLELGAEYQSPTQTVNQWPTTPAYVSPVDLPAVPATNDLAPASHNRTAIIVLAATVGLLLFLLVAVLFVRLNSGATPATPQVSIPTPPVPPNAPAPPVPPPVGDETLISESLRYPGAEETMVIKNAQGKHVLQLLTKDSASKVSAWYTSRLNPTEHVKLPFGNTILRAGDIAVVITGTEDGTTILITRGGD